MKGHVVGTCTCSISYIRLCPGDKSLACMYTQGDLLQGQSDLVFDWFVLLFGCIWTKCCLYDKIFWQKWVVHMKGLKVLLQRLVPSCALTLKLLKSLLTFLLVMSILFHSFSSCYFYIVPLGSIGRWVLCNRWLIFLRHFVYCWFATIPESFEHYSNNKDPCWSLQAMLNDNNKSSLEIFC